MPKTSLGHLSDHQRGLLSALMQKRNAPARTVRRQPLGDLMDQALSHGQGPISNVDGQDELAHGVYRDPYLVG